MPYSKEQLDFINKAQNSVSNDPRTRLGSKAKQIYTNNNYVFDAHCHVFDGECVKVTYLITRLLASFAEFLPPAIYWAIKRIFRRIFGVVTLNAKSMHFKKANFINDLLPGGNSSFDYVSLAEINEEFNQPIEAFIQEIEYNSRISVDSITVSDFLNDFEAQLDELEKQLNQPIALTKSTSTSTVKMALLSFDRKGFFKRVKQIIKILRSKQMSSVLHTFEHNYAINKVYNKRFSANKEQLTIVLGMDLNSGWQGSSEKTYMQQNTELAQLGKSEAILPFLPLDPRRANDAGSKNLYQVFLNAFDKNNPTYFGVKCYPALGYLPADPALDPIFKICAEKNIPVMTHCGGEMISTFASKIVAYRGTERVVIEDQRRKDRTRKLNEPSEWIPVLSKHENLRLCLGHFGGRNAWDGNPRTKHRIATILTMMNDFPNLYADFSFNLESPHTVQSFKDKIATGGTDATLMKERTLFGTDFWVVLPISDLNKDQDYFLKEMSHLKTEFLYKNVNNYLGI